MKILIYLERRTKRTRFNYMKRVPDSKTFDVTLMICLIRNLTSITEPINGFDTLPIPGETTPGSDLARIKCYRNKLAHHDSNTIDTAYFNATWREISDAVGRLGGQSMYQECQELKVKILDQSNQEIILEIKQSLEEMKELKQTMDSLWKEHSKVTENLIGLRESHSTLQTEHSKVKENLRDLQTSHSILQTSHSSLHTEHSKIMENMRELQDTQCTLQAGNSKVTEILTDPVPWNIRGQIKDELETWKEDDKTYIQTEAAKRILKLIKEKGCVVVTASSGCGKSSLVRHVALQMQTHGFDILPVSMPKKIDKWYNPNKKNLFVVDDFCGTYTLNPTKYENWKNCMQIIKTLVEKKQVKIIMSCRLQVYKDEKMKALSFFLSCECNLLSEGLRLSKTEKQSIAEFYLKTKASEIKEYYDMFDCFPLLCQLYSKNTSLNVVDFFKNPFTVYKEEIDNLQIEGAHDKYCALALCVVFNNYLKEEWLVEDVDKDREKNIKNTYEACKVIKGTSRLVIRDELDSLCHTFIRKDGDVYRTIHDKLFDFLAFYFGSVMIHCLINNATSRFISERFMSEKKRKNDEFTIILSEKYQQIYIKRMVNDWSKGNIQDVFCNINMNDHFFRQKFLLHIKGLEISQQKQLASSYDINSNNTPLIQCCFIGDIAVVKWCLNNNNADINKCRETGASPLYIACQEGHTEVVQMLIKSNADINKCRETGTSPLHIACEEGHTEVVQMLINYNADINKCTETGTSPLYIASEKGHTEVVRILINNKADIDKCKDMGASPLYIACWKGRTEIVQLLINSKADINKCSVEEVSPLYIACEKGHNEVVQMLINNKVDINKCKDTGASPLYIACQEGHIKVVQMLIKNKADITKCRDMGALPLYVACQVGHTEVVQMLINNKADINKCRDFGASPLYIACWKGHTEIVQMLINNKADINKCTETGASPLNIACLKGHTEVVQMLIQNKADINKCRVNGSSPLYIACQEGHTEIVQMLINNKADINKCRKTGESPIFVACYKGNTEIVELLLKHEADCNIKWRGLTPLDIARRNKHTSIVHLFQR
ncbi:uncharacterized protein LOC127723035 isoform X2 [Mytilus californianus]|uniref:uncharacterized protein LOC127723035 isoform X2 n=1 Tax=Mytilus californianus TaxID=6549 RepID=UPI00224576C3|nr:uncharacterized protein LOC127723035 isoform X2 [Mytilus californianus]